MGRAHEVRAASMAKTAAAKSKLNNKWSRIIYMAAKSGVPDPELNQSLKKEIEKAKKEQVTADVIKRAIDKAKGANMESYSELQLEGFGPGNSMVVVECLSDNSNRTQTAVKVALQRTGGKIASSGNVTHSFTHNAVFSTSELSEDEILETLLMADCDVSDTKVEDGVVTVYAPSTEYAKMRAAIFEAYPDVNLIEDTIAWVPMNWVQLESDKQMEQFKRLLDLLAEEEDVQEVFHNVKGVEEDEE